MRTGGQPDTLCFKQNFWRKSTLRAFLGLKTVFFDQFKGVIQIFGHACDKKKSTICLRQSVLTAEVQKVSMVDCSVGVWRSLS